MTIEETDWHITCDPNTFERCRNNPKFAYIVTLARAVNALNFVNSVMVTSHGKDDPAAQRDRINAYLFGSAICTGRNKKAIQRRELFAFATRHLPLSLTVIRPPRTWLASNGKAVLQ